VLAVVTVVVAMVRGVIFGDTGRSVVLNPLNLDKPFYLVNDPFESFLAEKRSSTSKVVGFWCRLLVLMLARYGF
jgi:hypothetical protein